MKVKTIIPLIIILFLCVGLFFLSKGITGMVVSESCCSGPDCDIDNLCDFSKSSSDVSFVGFGSILVLISALVFVMLHSKVGSI